MLSQHACSTELWVWMSSLEYVMGACQSAASVHSHLLYGMEAIAISHGANTMTAASCPGSIYNYYY